MMRIRKTIFTFLLLLITANNYAQLGFCSGSKGDPVFTENFGNGTTAGPALPAGTTTYGFSPVAPGTAAGPNDGLYTIQNTSNFYAGNWHNAPDHTPDATNGPNGKMLIVNAAFTPGDFYKKTVTGLCVNTTFEFSAWMMNVFRIHPGNCAPDIPVNVRFEIWNSTETVLLASGNTGNIFGTPTPIWQQFALVFTTVSDTSVVLKMKNNGVGGCGNDVAIDDISFAACGDPTTVGTIPTPTPGNIYSSCNPPSLTLGADTSVPYFYQWQSSTDGINWTDIAGETNATYQTLAGLSTLTYFRVKAAQDAANLGNPFCSINSNTFTISPLAGPNTATGTNQVICSSQAIPPLSVTVPAGTSVNWYSLATGGILLQANSTTYTPTAAGTYYAETYNTTTNCISSSRLPIMLTINPLPTVSINGNPVAVGNTYATCNNPASLQLNAVVSGASAYVYQWQMSTDATTWSDIAGANGPTYTPSVASSTYFRVKVAQDATSLSTNFCTAISNVFTISILPAPSPAVNNGDKVICSNQPIPSLSVTPSAGASVNWYNSATGGTLLQANSASYTPSAAGTYYAETYISPGCVAISRTPVMLTITALPTVSINANPLVIGNNYATCNSPASVLLNAVVSGAPAYFYQWEKSTDGTNWSNIAGATNATYNATNITALTYFRVKVAQDAASLTTNFCMATSNVFTVTILPGPVPAVSNGDQIICSGQAIPALSVIPAAGTSINWYNALTGGTLLQANSASYTPTAAGTYYAETYNVTTNCIGSPRTPVKLTIVALPTALISANPSVLCSGQTSMLHISGTPNAVVRYAAVGGSTQSVTLNGAGFIDVPTAPLSAGATYQLIDVTLGSCSQLVPGSVSIAVNPKPIAAYSGNIAYCEGDAIALALSSTIAGTIFSWTVAQSGTAGAISGTGNLITQALTLQNGTTGTATYTVTPYSNGCAGNAIAITVTVYPLPVPLITDGVICTTGSTQTSYVLDTQLNPADHSFQWFFGGSATPIPGATANTYAANQIGVYTVVATSTAGCSSDPVSATVGQMPKGENLVLQQLAAFSDNPTITVTVIGGGGPYLYQLDGFAFQESNVFQDVSAGTHTITVVDDYCTNLTASVTILDYPRYFTPNQDGFNDTWNIEGVDNAVIGIFDRYGKLLQQISSNGLGWDGIYNGRLLPATDYWFTIDYVENGSEKTFKAHFSLKR